MHRSKMSEDERRLRSRLAQWVNSGEIIHATLSRRKIMCGKPNCRCGKGNKHEALYLVRSKKGHIKQLHIPKDCEKKVEEWVGKYKQICEGLEKISGIYWNKIHNREE